MKSGLVFDDQISKPGGIQEYVKGLYWYLKKHNQKVKIISTGSSCDSIPRDDQILVKKRSLKFNRKNDVSSFPIIPVAPKWLKEKLKEENFDLLSFQAPFGPLSFRILDFSKAPKNFTFHVNHSNFPIIKRAGLKFYSFWTRKYVKKADGFIAVSKTAKQFALKIYKIPPERFKIIPCGLDLSRFTPPEEKKKRKKVNILFVGRIMSRKGVIHLLKSFTEIKKKHPKTSLTFVGSGSYKNKIKKMIKKEKIKDVSLAGFVPDENLPEYYQKSDIFCAPSLDGESFGIVLIEAMASGLPICGYANEGYEQVFPSHAKKLFPKPGNQEELTKALKKLVQDYKLRQKQGEKNLKYVQKYSWEKVGDKVLKHFEKIVTSST